MSSSRRKKSKSHHIWSSLISKPKSKLTHSSISSLRNLVKHDIENAISPSTRQKYSSAWRSFFQFCQAFNLEFSPNFNTLSFYIAVTCHSISPRSVEVYLSGISFMFKSKFPHLLCQTNHPTVRQTLKGCKKQFSKPVVRKEPLNLQLLELAVSSLGRSFDEILFLAILSLGFASLHRLGELVSPDNHLLFDSRKVILRSSFIFSNCGKFASYCLPYHKGDSNFLGSPCAIQFFRNSSACPIRRLKSYLRLRDFSFNDKPALFIRANSSLPSRSWFLKIFHSIFPMNFSGHSLRSGGATALAQNGASMEYIQSAGRWSSEAFRCYVWGHVLLRLPERLNHPIVNVQHTGAFVSFSRKSPYVHLNVPFLFSCNLKFYFFVLKTILVIRYWSFSFDFWFDNLWHHIILSPWIHVSPSSPLLILRFLVD